MSEITPKSPEVIQAQVATFAAERVEHYQDSGHIFNNLGSLALGEAVDNYSNPDWVTERIAQDQEWKRQQAERAKKPATDGWITLDTV